MLNLPIYMDNHATTRTDPRVVETILPYFSENFGNANSVHIWPAAPPKPWTKPVLRSPR